MKPVKVLGSGIKVLLFLVAFGVVILFNALISPEIAKNAMFWFRSGDYYSLVFVLAETFVIGIILRELLMWYFRAEFKRR